MHFPCKMHHCALCDMCTLNMYELVVCKVNWCKSMCKIETVNYYLLNPAHALHGGISYFAFVCVCLSVCPLTKYLKKY